MKMIADKWTNIQTEQCFREDLLLFETHKLR